jgi:hypothetical protein
LTLIRFDIEKKLINLLGGEKKLKQKRKYSFQNKIKIFIEINLAGSKEKKYSVFRYRFFETKPKTSLLESLKELKR